MENKQIGIFGWKTGDNSFGCTLPYLLYIQRFGIPRILTMEERIDPTLDLVIVPGGMDVDPLRYEEKPHLLTSKVDPIKEYFDTRVLPEYIRAEVPIFGICRGCQSIAVLFGAKLIQHMYHETNEDDRFSTVHNIDLTGDFGEELYGYGNSSKKLSVNSMHHQCISDEDFPAELEVIGRYSGPKKYDKTIEIIRHRSLPIYGVQYHPEEMMRDPVSDYIMTTLLSVEQMKIIFEEE